MKRTKENMFEKRFQFALALLLKGNDTYIDIGKLHYRGATAKRLYERLKSTLDLMGIQYYNVSGTMRMRVPKPKELEEDKQEYLGLHSTFDAAWLQHIPPIVIKRPEVHGIIKMDSISFHTGRRAGKSTIAKPINERPRQIITDDMLDSMVNGMALRQSVIDNVEGFFGDIIHKYIFDEVVPQEISELSFATYMGYRLRSHP